MNPSFPPFSMQRRLGSTISSVVSLDVMIQDSRGAVLLFTIHNMILKT